MVSPRLFRRIIVPVIALVLAPTGAKSVLKGEPDPSGAHHAVMIFDNRGDLCSGVVIEPTAVLTAAHCVTGAEAWRVHFRNHAGEPVLIEPKRITVHPEYDPQAIKKRTRSVDLAVVTLDAPLPAPFEPVALGDDTPLGPGEPVTLGGYGYATEKLRTSVGTYRAVPLTVVEPHGHGTLIVWLADPKVASGASGAGGCLGDSGGPILKGGALVAITVWTTGPGKSDCGTFTQGLRIAPFRDWIASVLTR